MKKRIFSTALCYLLCLAISSLGQPKGYLVGNGKGQYERDTVLKPIPTYALTELHRGMTFGFLAKNGYFSSKEGLARSTKWPSSASNG